MAKKFPRLSVIIPIGPKECQWQELLFDLSFLDDRDEIILCVGENKKINDLTIFNQLIIKLHCRVRLAYSKWGRALQMNTGAGMAKNPFLWFLHADTKLDKSCIDILRKNLAKAPYRFYYFKMKFLNDGPSTMVINEWGLKYRCKILGIPFGDQGLCLSKKIFKKCKGFDQKAPFAEDHLLVWSAKKLKIPFSLLDTTLYTSARLYKDCGWAKITLKNLWYTYKEVFKQMASLFNDRWKPKKWGKI